MTNTVKKIKIVTEGEFDAQVLRKLLPQNPKIKFEILPASGFSSALSKVRSLLMQTDNPILLLLDTDTVDEREILEKKQFVESYTNGKFYKDNFKAVWAIPEFEIIFFNNKQFLQDTLNKKISNEIWDLAKVSPRKTLERISDRDRDYFVKLLDNKDTKSELSKDKIIQEILDFAEQQ